MQQNAIAARAWSRTPLGSLQRSPNPLLFSRGPLRCEEEGEGKWKEKVAVQGMVEGKLE